MGIETETADRAEELGAVIGEIEADYRVMCERLEPHRDDRRLAPFLDHLRQQRAQIQELLTKLPDRAGEITTRLDEVLQAEQEFGRDFFDTEEGRDINSGSRPVHHAVVAFYRGMTGSNGDQMGRRSDQRRRLQALQGTAVAPSDRMFFEDGLAHGRTRSHEVLDASVLQDVEDLESLARNVATDDRAIGNDLAAENRRLTERISQLLEEGGAKDRTIAEMRTAIDSMGVADSLAQTTARAQADGVGQGLADVQQLQERIDDLLRRDAQSHATIRRLLEEARAHQGVQVPASPQSPPGRIPWQMDPGATDGIRRAAQRYASLSRGPLARNRGKIAAAYLAVAAILAPSAALGGVIIAAPTAAVGYAGVRGWEEWQTRREVGKVGDRLVVLVDRLHSAPLDPTAREQLIEAIRNELQVMAFAWGRRTALHERGIISRFRTLRAEMAVRRVIRRGKADERTLRQIATCDMFNEDARERAVDFYAHVGLDPDDVGSLTTKDMQEICDRALDRRPNHERREIDSAAPEPGSAEVGL